MDCLSVWMDEEGWTEEAARREKGGGGGEVMTTDRPLSTSCAPDCFVRDKSH